MTLLILALACRPEKDAVEETGDVGTPVGEDLDGDGYSEDCNDQDPGIFPGAAEICDGIDNDCNGLVDDDAGDASDWYLDDDGDGYGDPETSVESCAAVPGYVLNAKDCDDDDARFNPSAIESDCEDPNDYNCDGSVGYADADGDGFAACQDCDDSAEDVNEDAAEVCNDLDDNCNGFVDDADPLLTGASTWYLDADGDDYGGQRFSEQACEQPDGYVDNDDDCDDLDGDSNPGASEVCDEADNDCDGTVDEDVQDTFYADTDGDGYGDATVTTLACDAPAGFSYNDEDCDDTSALTSPASWEICDDEDNNCDGDVDESSALDAITWYADLDEDGYGDDSSSLDACDEPSGYVEDGGDCDDGDDGVNPGATEVWYDGVDSDCDGASDYDADGDGYDHEDYSGSDCDDTDASEYADCSLYDFTDHTFTNCSATGRNGPTLSACRSAYSPADSWDEDSDYFDMTTQGIQEWTVPEDGTYEIEAVGAASGTNSNYTTYQGRGIYIYGEFTLTEGDVLQILVGQQGQSVNLHAGAGGGSFVVSSGGTPLIIAGGGGAPCRGDNHQSRQDATSSNSGVSSTCSAGSSGSGGVYCGYGPGGGGFSGDGGNGPGQSTGGKSFQNGGQGGQCDATCGSNAGAGGFGGGGGTYHDIYGGGGGGYSGGGGGTYCEGGGGGGSYNTGSNSTSSSGFNTSHGYVTITLQ